MRESSPFTFTTRRQTRTMKVAVFILFLILYNLSNVWTDEIMNNGISATLFLYCQGLATEVIVTFCFIKASFICTEKLKPLNVKRSSVTRQLFLNALEKTVSSFRINLFSNLVETLIFTQEWSLIIHIIHWLILVHFNFIHIMLMLWLFIFFYNDALKRLQCSVQEVSA